MEQDILDRIDSMDAKINDIHASTRKTQRYIQITAWITIVLFVLPLIGLFFAIPKLLSSVDTAMSIIQ